MFLFPQTSVMWKTTALMFASMLLFSITLQVTSKERCPIKTNGCSVPGGLPFFYKKTFTPACEKHDVCYSCVRNPKSVVVHQPFT